MIQTIQFTINMYLFKFFLLTCKVLYCYILFRRINIEERLVVPKTKMLAGRYLF